MRVRKKNTPQNNKLDPEMQHVATADFFLSNVGFKPHTRTHTDTHTESGIQTLSRSPVATPGS